MKREFSRSWESSSKKRKQRKYRYNAPLHIKHKFLGAHLSKELHEKYHKRAITLKKDDKVKVLRGQYKKLIGKVERVNINKEIVYVRGAEINKKDGTKAFYPIHPSNLLIMELNLNDKKRLDAINRGIKR